MLVEELGRYAPFRKGLHEAASTRPSADIDRDELEYLRWLCDHFEYIATAGLGTLSHVQFELLDVFTDLRATREKADGRRWSTRAEERIALTRERLVNAEIDRETYDSIIDRIAIDESRPHDEPLEDLGASRFLTDNAAVVVLGEPGSGKTTLLRHLALADRVEGIIEPLEAARQAVTVAPLRTPTA